MTPKDVLDYLDSVLSVEALRRLDQASLQRLENLLHHWYVQAGDVRRAKIKSSAHAPIDRARRAGPAITFTLTPPGADEHATHPGAI